MGLRAIFEVKERPLPAAASPEGETFSTGAEKDSIEPRFGGVILAIVSTGLFTAIALGLVGAYWVGSLEVDRWKAVLGAQEAEGKAHQGTGSGLCHAFLDADAAS